MYDRQSRVFTFYEKRGTDDNVGPGSYCPFEPKCTKYEIGYAPFDSFSERSLCLAQKNWHETPGPSAYNVRLPYHRVKGCTSVSNKADRFPRFISTGPGPDAYAIHSNLAGRKPDVCGLLSGDVKSKVYGDYENAQTMANLCNRILSIRHQDVPSIPSGKYTCGYEERPDGSLRLQTEFEAGSKPDFRSYLTHGEPVFTRYQGCGWSKRTSDRSPTHRPACSVGPGQYEPFMDHWEKLVSSAKERNLIQKEHLLNVPRFMEKIMWELKKENLPGPSAYHPKIDTFRGANPIGSSGEVIKSAPFNCEAERFKEKYGDNPGPDAYKPSVSAIRRRWEERFKTKPFDSSANRMLVALNSNPAPNAYSINQGIADLLLHKVDAKKFLKDPVGFGSTAKRSDSRLFSGKSNLKKANLSLTPGPADYKPEKSVEMKVKKFAKPTLSTAKRESFEPKSAAPAPGVYNLGRSFDATQCKRTPSLPYTKEGKHRRACFTTTAERFGKNSCIGPKDPTLPGPSDYCIKFDGENNKGKFVYQCDRFKNCEDDPQPGPADYQLSSTVVDSVLKSTFNVTLENADIINEINGIPLGSESVICTKINHKGSTQPSSALVASIHTQ